MKVYKDLIENCFDISDFDERPLKELIEELQKTLKDAIKKGYSEDEVYSWIETEGNPVYFSTAYYREKTDEDILKELEKNVEYYKANLNINQSNLENAEKELKEWKEAHGK